MIVAMLCLGYISSAQTLSYNDIGVLFSTENINGTARYNGMSGAFGALGGDVSAIDLNPAGLAVFLNSEFGLTFTNNDTKTRTSFYGNNNNSENDYGIISQSGGVFVFDMHSNTGWRKIALGFNYNITNDFENFWFAEGNSGFAPISDFYDNDPVVYVNSDGQYFENITDGRSSKYTFSFAGQYNDNLYVGASINTYDIEYYQRVLVEEYNNDGNGNTFDVSQNQELFTFGEGFSFNLGIISKPNDNVRLGLALQSPIWYNLTEEFTEFEVELYETGIDTFSENSGLNIFDYRLRTSGKLTGSFAYIFEEQGLISIDYIYRNYSNSQLSRGDFSSENQSFNSDLKGTGELRIGTEWRLDNISLRGGYHMEKSPYKNAIDSDDIQGYSLGAGFKFRGGKIDFAYQNSTNTAPYGIYDQSNQVDAVELDFDTSKITATLVLNI